jgi:hypothetical protein
MSREFCGARARRGGPRRTLSAGARSSVQSWALCVFYITKLTYAQKKLATGASTNENEHEQEQRTASHEGAGWQELSVSPGAERLSRTSS